MSTADRVRDRVRYRPSPDDGRVLFSSRHISPILNIVARLGIAIGALVVTTLVVYFERDCYADRGNTGTLTLVDALYYAAVSLSTTGYGDIVPVCESSRLMNVFLITPLRFLFLIVLVGTTVEVLTRRTRDEFRTSRWRKRVNDHTIIIGYGVKGAAAAKALVDAGQPKDRIVIVSPERAQVEEATQRGFVAVLGDARRESVLKDAVIDRAAKIIVATDEDDTSVLVTLTARRLAPHARIVAPVRQEQNADILRQSGADTIIPTAESAGKLMALSLISPAAGDIMEDLLDTGQGLEVIERAVVVTEIGKASTEIDSQDEIVLAIVRGGHVHRFDTPGSPALQDGDRLVVIRPNPS